MHSSGLASMPAVTSGTNTAGTQLTNTLRWSSSARGSTRKATQDSPGRTVFDVEVPGGLSLGSAITQVQVRIVCQQAAISARAWLKRGSSN